ncbi:nitrate reductase [Microbacterium sp. AR7-10]|uniref:NCS1 family nucleobase:cation symporter-1 n=2 Tax=Microbacteriaceae TaxID=85023 RepID=A0ABR8W3V6_9MICO|nr:NCS1 family nucleobase:cation symporter-1 [Microbacterium commune]OIU88713.1 nitrate reductase [Microbacterium sp. AR7-10]
MMSRTITDSTSTLYNVDLAPESASGTWKTWNLFAWWMSGWHSLAGYSVAIGLFATGLVGWQVMIAFVIGVTIIYFANNLSGVAGQRERVPFPVFARASFGVRGANIPAVLRGVVGVFWYGVQTYLASQAVMILLVKVFPATLSLTETSFLGLSALGWICFLALSLAQALALANGMETVRKLSDFAGPVIWIAMIALAVWMLARAEWSIDFNFRTVETGGGFVGMVAAAFILVAYFGGPTLNFADFSRNAPTAAMVRRGNMLGLLINATAFGIVSIVIALAAVKVHGSAVSDPLELLYDLDNVAALLIALVAIAIATAGINVIYNFVAPVYDILQVWPRRFTFRSAGVVIAVVSILITPWNLFANPVIVNQMVGGVGALMGPLYGILMVDYYLLRGKSLNTQALFDDSSTGAYWYSKGYNPRAVVALLVAGVVTVCMTLLPPLAATTAFTWPVGVLLAGGVYFGIGRTKSTEADRTSPQTVAGDA